MKFNLITSGYFYKTKDKLKLEQLGFKFKTTKEIYGKHTRGEWYFEQNYDKPVSIEIRSLEELIQFSKEWGRIIVSGDEIEIYDDYRE